jgi:dTDP-4-amino-4,6-dideoxygalactose transaminase
MIPIARPQIGEEEKAAVMAVLVSGQLAQGPRVHEFEERFAAMCGVKYAVATSSGTSALHIAMLAHDIGPGDEVITTPFSFVASANCALYVGARPVFADIEPDYFTLDPAEIERHITPKTRAIVPVHLYGQACNMETLAEVARAHNLIIIEDACQAHGASLNGRPVGSWGTACYSFYPTKNMTTIEGGIITTNDAQVADRARLLRDHGSPKRYTHQILGYNLRLTDLQAAIGLAQLPKLAAWNVQRQANAAYLTSKLKDVAGLQTPAVREGAEHVFHQYTVRLENRDEVLPKLTEKGIGFGIHYPTPIHQQPLYCELGYRDHLPQAEAACQQVLSLPVHPSLSTAELDAVVAAIS